jgi:hypothetical protein
MTKVTESIQPQQIELFIVVSHKFNRALGPFMDVNDATKVAAQLTAVSQSGKVYVPVPFYPIAGVQVMEGHNPGPTDEDDGSLPGWKKMQNNSYL